MSSIIHCRGLNYRYEDGSQQNQIINNLNLEVQAQESIAILGQSGCGKSTLLNLLGGIDRPSSGQVIINNTDLSTLNETQITQLRADNLGFVYQFHHLLKDFSAINNVMMPLLIQGIDKKSAQQAATKMLTSIGLEHRYNHLPSELSGGERQRVAIARALITQPKCLLADEPTGNLDRQNADEVLNLMIKLNQTHNSALVIVTHDERIAEKMQRVLVLENGQFS
ncbi:MAG: lipoprotein-releasing ABC transporter ATP-binding protein LolD [Candidatus Thioglobus sp.]|nr:lipoprotein-releasing ABC transporter ATP-binding protein LolD [Candidatus Thioglobus pontius]MBL6984232.1 lipoprotein-releasing ABC transporter ATP-binding protein LolD [Candidatus Thioglobus sp.]